MSGKNLLDIDGSRKSIGRTRKSHEEAITLRIDLVTTMLLESCAQQAPIRIKELTVSFTQLMEKVR
jgi:hypothetical protein